MTYAITNPYIELVLLGVRDRKTYREIATDIGKTHGMVQYYLRTELFPKKLVTREINPFTGRAKARSLVLTAEGKEALKNAGHRCEPN